MDLEKNMLLLNYLFDGAYLVDENCTILFWNPAAEIITGYNSSEVIGSKCCNKILLRSRTKGNDLCNNTCPLNQALKDGLPKEMSILMRHKEGHQIPITIRTIPILDDFGVPTFVMETFTTNNCISNFNQIKELARKAFIDSRSGLPNKEYMDNKLRSLLAGESIVDSNTLGLLFIHLDNLREINDEFGTAIGDMTLKVIGKTLSANIQSEDIVGRLDGGLFLIITHLDKKFLMLNWANKLKNLIQQSTIADHEKLSMKIYISGLIATTGESLETVYNILEDELKSSREIAMNVSIRDFTPPK